ncbi:MAG: hypothetical protein EU981_04615 [Candidatus Liberibacter ctenarytainae]|uniref:Uncharacterized protein n=1 Tax=Candidatus Liberibacter ctenarytainae TaxID=2020335 RepID=A0A937AR09_9HYPH|nr:hypothetical protein [Candidatus Liberibacter ctenarytainae]
MTQHFWIELDLFVILATLATYLFMNKQISWWIRFLMPCFLIITMLIHIAYLSGYIGMFLFLPLPIIL